MIEGAKKTQNPIGDTRPNGLLSNNDSLPKKRTIYFYENNRVIFRVRMPANISLSKLRKTACCILRRFPNRGIVCGIRLWTRIPGLMRRPINSDADLSRAFCHAGRVHLDVVSTTQNKMLDLNTGAVPKESNMLDKSHQNDTQGKDEIRSTMSRTKNKLATILVSAARDPSRSALLAKMYKWHKNNPNILRVLEILKANGRMKVQ